ncbi:hypothetical protein VNI00_016952 [Paramarasmius palmivorus]|uniref:Uncharacterized protein n=1 Tax=Paramarasmius palmivorus TaxID=297713 RepID=A0AAW0BAP1_9AGAR
MGGFALYNGEEFCGHLWDRDRTLEIEEANFRPFEGKAEGYFERIKAYHEKHQKVDNTDESSNEQTLDSPTQTENPFTTNPSEKLLSPPSDSTTILEFLVAKGYITLTEDEIKDNLSHSDVITKSIAVIQTIWFIMQVIARAVDGLAITELEIITVGFAILNFGTYFLWWNKPLRVRHPVRVYWRQREMDIKGREGEEEEQGKEETEGKGKEEREEGWLCWLGRAATSVIGYIWFNTSPEGFISWILELVFLPLLIPFHIFDVCLYILRDNDCDYLAIPISSRLDNDPLHLYIAVYGIATLFGTIHCIPWVFQFPTHTEQLLWRISAVAVAVAPIAMGVLHGYFNTLIKSTPVWLDNMVKTLLVVLSLAYAVFRVTLLIIAFTTLRDLTPSAYQTVQWTTFIPHIG